MRWVLFLSPNTQTGVSFTLKRSFDHCWKQNILEEQRTKYTDGADTSESHESQGLIWVRKLNFPLSTTSEGGKKGYRSHFTKNKKGPFTIHGKWNGPFTCYNRRGKLFSQTYKITEILKLDVQRMALFNRCVIPVPCFLFLPKKNSKRSNGFHWDIPCLLRNETCRE